MLRCKLHKFIPASIGRVKTRIVDVNASFDWRRTVLPSHFKEPRFNELTERRFRGVSTNLRSKIDLSKSVYYLHLRNVHLYVVYLTVETERYIQSLTPFHYLLNRCEYEKRTKKVSGIFFLPNAVCICTLVNKQTKIVIYKQRNKKTKNDIFLNRERISSCANFSKCS